LRFKSARKRIGRRGGKTQKQYPLHAIDPALEKALVGIAYSQKGMQQALPVFCAK
jgi:hypothetical protein